MHSQWLYKTDKLIALISVAAIKRCHLFIIYIISCYQVQALVLGCWLSFKQKKKCFLWKCVNTCASLKNHSFCLFNLAKNKLLLPRAPRLGSSHPGGALCPWKLQASLREYLLCVLLSASDTHSCQWKWFCCCACLFWGREQGGLLCWCVRHACPTFGLECFAVEWPALCFYLLVHWQFSEVLQAVT